MRRLLFPFALVGGIAWWLLGRGRQGPARGATIGYEDGTSVALADGSPELDRLLQIAAEARSS